jgi:hypothetical protein
MSIKLSPKIARFVIDAINCKISVLETENQGVSPEDDLVVNNNNDIALYKNIVDSIEVDSQD